VRPSGTRRDLKKGSKETKRGGKNHVLLRQVKGAGSRFREEKKKKKGTKILNSRKETKCHTLGGGERGGAKCTQGGQGTALLQDFLKGKEP